MDGTFGCTVFVTVWIRTIVLILVLNFVLVRVLVLTTVRTIVLGGAGWEGVVVDGLDAGGVTGLLAAGGVVAGLLAAGGLVAGCPAVELPVARELPDELLLCLLRLVAVVIRLWAALVTLPPAPCVIVDEARLSDPDAPLVIRGPLCRTTLPAALPDGLLAS